MSPATKTPRPKRLAATPELIDLMRQVYPSGGWPAVQTFHPELESKQITSLAHSRSIKLNAKGKLALSCRRSAAMLARAKDAASRRQPKPPAPRYADWSKPDSDATRIGAPTRHRFASIFHLAQGIAA
jgi:hypothetical protein